MRIHRILLAISCSSLLLASSVFAAAAAQCSDQCKDQCKDKCADQCKDKCSDKAAPKAKAACDCPKDKDGKVCGTDKDCCCTGAKACKPDQKCEKPAAKPGDAKTS
jgi:hypothetical protein